MFTAWPSTTPLEVRASGHGAPVAGREVRIRDRAGSLADGASGEICVRGRRCSRTTTACRLPSASTPTASSTPAISDASTKRGTVHFLGRLKDVIKTAGRTSRRRRSRRRWCGIGRRCGARRAGAGGARGEDVAAFVVASAPVATADLIAHCPRRAGELQVPRHVWLRRGTSCCRCASGKGGQGRSARAGQAARRLVIPARRELDSGPRGERNLQGFLPSFGAPCRAVVVICREDPLRRGEPCCCS